jgi:3-hydroxyacyl-CoA dehydrogenase/enoyl-CoA hydratase/3-hydroxybutyryl-CoA epimerase
MLAQRHGQGRAIQVRWLREVCILQLDDPERRINTFTRDVFLELETVLRGVLAIPGLRGIVFTSGKETWCAGGDLSMFLTLRDAAEAQALCAHAQSVVDLVATAPVPTVAALHGTCVGGGLELALACHQRIATPEPSTWFALPERRMGFLPGAGATQWLPRRGGIALALEMLLSARPLSAQALAARGVIEALVPRHELLDTAVSLCLADSQRLLEQAQQVRSRGGLSRALTVEALRQARIEQWLPEGLELEQLISHLGSDWTPPGDTSGGEQAVVAAVDAVLCGMERSLEAGLELEARLVGRLLVTAECRALLELRLDSLAFLEDA